jgi:hypothetical protein
VIPAAIAGVTGFERKTFFKETPVPFSAEQPPHWHIYPGMGERWMGGDPALCFNNPADSSVRVTYYGLEKSRFNTPEAFIDFLKRTLDEPEQEKEMTVGNQPAKYFRFRYSYEGFTDHHGARVPAEAVYEEFVIVPVEKGFYSFNLSLHRRGQDPALETQSELQAQLTVNLRDIKDWNQFLESVQFQKTGAVS